MAEGPTLALRYMKDNLDEALLFDFATARDHEASAWSALTMTADHKEAVQAFIDKRKPVFRGNNSRSCAADRSVASRAPHARRGRTRRSASSRRECPAARH